MLLKEVNINGCLPPFLFLKGSYHNRILSSFYFKSVSDKCHFKTTNRQRQIKYPLKAT